MQSRAQLLALLDQAAQDPSSARRLLQQAHSLVDRELRTEKLPPPGYVYAGAQHLIATFDRVDIEALPDPDYPQIPPLCVTSNDPGDIKIPYDMLIEGVSAAAVPILPTGLDATQLNGLLEMSANADGRDLFSIQWGLDGDNLYCTDGTRATLEPAMSMVGTRPNPRALGWMATRGRILNVWVRNLTNAINPTGFASEREPGWPLAITVEFHGVKLEAA